jgi:uncharacterized protein YndB with AHSA1/START domain
MNVTALVYNVTLDAPRERVFTALTDARDLRHWFCDVCESELRANGRLVMRWTREGSSPEPFEARWVEFAPPSRAGFQGGSADYPNRNAGTVWFELAEDGPGTRLTVHHEVPTGGSYEPFLESWREAWPRALDKLLRYLTPLADPRG